MADQHKQQQAWSNIFAKRPPPGPADKAAYKKPATSKTAAARAPAAAAGSETPDQANVTTSTDSSSSKVRPSSALLVLCFAPKQDICLQTFITAHIVIQNQLCLLQSVKYNKDGLFADPQRRTQQYKEIKPKIEKVS